MGHGDPRVSCDVTVPEEILYGRFANAFRVLSDGTEYLLDFIVYTQQEDCAVVVARVRIHETMIQAMRERLGSTMMEISDPTQARSPREEIH